MNMKIHPDLLPANHRYAAAFILALFFGTLVFVPRAARAATGTHLPDSTFYPRLIRLHHAPGALKNTLLAKTTNKLYRSTDDGRTFTYLTSVPTIPESDKSSTSVDKERCCTTLYELPRRIVLSRPEPSSTPAHLSPETRLPFQRS